VRVIGKEPEHSTEHYTENLHQYIRDHAIESHIKFLGFREDIPTMLSQLDILVVPSLQEPFGKIVIEGMAMAKPVVASRVGGIPEIILNGETGLLVPPGDTEALRRALYTLITNPEKRYAMGRRGRQRVEQDFALSQNIRKTEEVYASLLQGKS
jgi:glycosyltransferase involved in cell wall biosynthesis